MLGSIANNPTSNPSNLSSPEIKEQMVGEKDISEKSMGVSVIIPAYNEEKAVVGQVNEVKHVLDEAGITYEIIVVDDGSTDGTQAAVLGSDARLLTHSSNMGYGASLKIGIHAAINETIVIIDADCTYPTDQIPTILGKLNGSDMVIGARIGEKVNIPWTRRIAKWFLHILARQITGKRIMDLNSGLRAFRRTYMMQYYSILPDKFSFTTTSTLAYLADGYRIIDHPINYHPRIGQSKIVSWHFLDFVVLIIRMSMMFNPLRVFVPMAAIFGILGILKTIFDIVGLFSRTLIWNWSMLFQPVLSTSAVLLLFIGFQWLMIGMVADGVVRRVAFLNRPLEPSQSIDYLIV